MRIADRFELILALMAVVVVLELLARRLRMPPAGAFILGGIAMALIPGMPRAELDPDLALVLFLPPLLMADAYLTPWRDFRANLRVILQLAVGAVVFTTAIVGVVAHLMVPSLPWAACFTLGAIVSPPDAVAAKAVLEHVRLPRRVVVLLEGESLINDATGLVLYRFSVTAALTGAFSLSHATASFAVLSFGGVATGAILGYVGTAALGRLRDPVLATLGSFLLGWAAYIGAEAISASGVLATVACGMVVGWRQHFTLSAETRLAARTTWEIVTFVLESLIFILIGLSLRGVVERLDGSATAVATLSISVAAIVATVVLSRFAWMFPAVYVVRALWPALRRRDPYPPLGVPLVMSWAGMRGVVSLAAALALPIGFPGRDFIVAATFVVILVTVLVQGATLSPLIRAVRLDRFSGLQGPMLREPQARARMVQAEFAAIQKLSAQPDGTQRHPRLLEQYGYRARAAERFSAAENELATHRHDHYAAVLAAIAAGRAEIVRLHKRGEIHDSVLAVLEGELDLEELATRRSVTSLME